MAPPGDYNKFDGKNRTINVIPYLFEKGPDGYQIKPSLFRKEMELSANERYEKLLTLRVKPPPASELNFQSFKLSPPIIIFQAYSQNSIYTIPLSVRNISLVVKPLRMCFEKTPFFDVVLETGCEDRSSRVAPGMSIQYNVKFFPADDIDYTHKINFFTEGGNFEIPIIAIGSRPILDISDCISIPIGAVNIPSEKIIPVRNVGKVDAVFKFQINPPFHVTPDEGILVPLEILQLKVLYKSETAGQKKEKLILSYDSGEQLCIDVTGGAKNINVYLDRKFIHMDNTYRQLSTQKKLKIFNKSDQIVKFAWKQYENKNVQDEEKIKYEQLFSAVCSSEKFKTNKLEFYDVVNIDASDIVEERIYHDEILYLEKNEEFLYIDKNFSIIPLTGEIWPDDYCEVIVVFRPTELNEHSSTAYCDITGHENRFALDLKGTGIGPTVELNVVELNIGVTYLHSPQSYELVVHNKSHVPAKISFLDIPTVFGGKIACYPMYYTIPPFENYAFVIKFISYKQGEFIEDIKFQIEDTGEILTCVLRGKVLVPKIYFDVDEINFGVIPIGFTATKTISLCNTGNLDVHFSLRVLHDGTEPPLTSRIFASSSIKPSFPLNPKELSFDPMEGDVPQKVTMPLKVKLTPNRVGTFSMPLLLDMWETETETEQVLIKWSSVVPNIECDPQIIDLPFCFLNYAYNRTLKITNLSEIMGYFYIIPHKIYPNAPIIVSLGLNELYLDGGGTIEIPFTVICTKLGENSISLNMLVLGQDNSQLLCTIKCKGKGPVVSLNKELIDFGNVNLLTQEILPLEVISDAPIPAEFKISFANPHSFWKAIPCEGLIEPGATLNIDISVSLYDRGKFNDKIIVSVLHGCVVTCNVVAIGIGSSIVIEPSIAPEYDFGTLFASKKYSFQFNVHNRGTKTHRIIIRRELKKTKTTTRNSKVYIEDNKCPFHIVPDKFCLTSRTFIPITIEVYKDVVSCVTQNYYLEASIEKQSLKEFITNATLKAEFVEPVLYVSTHDLYFRVDRGNDKTFFHVQDSFDITNHTVVPIDIEINVEEPFYVLDPVHGILSKCETDISKSETHRINVFYQCNEWVTLRSYSIDRKLKLKFKHNNYEEIINLHADVYFPNISIIPQNIDFRSIPIGVYTYMDIQIRNVSPLSVSYIWRWKESSIKLEYFDDVDKDYIKNQPAFGSTAGQLDTSIFDLSIYPGISQNSELNDLIFANYLESMAALPSSSFFQKSILKINMSQLNNRDETEIKKLYCFLKNVCFGLCHPYFDPVQNQEISIYKNLQKEKYQNTILDLFDVTPYYGTLEPFEIQTIRVAFHPYKSLKVSAELELLIKDGPTEIVHISGMASRISYDISTKILNFGQQVFCEICVKSITLKNTGIIGFDYVITRPTFGATMPSHHLLQAAWMAVDPRKGFLEADKSIDLTVRYFPGIIGSFSEVLEIQIGYETPIIVEVNGYGVIPQIYLSLPRTILADNPVTLGYTAISSITEDWLLNFQNIKLNNMEDFKAYYDQDIPHCDRLYLRRDGWDVLSFNETFPSKMDIELALERFVIFHHIENHPEMIIEHTKTKSRFLNNLYVPHYTLNLGAVIIDTIITHTIIILNYGPFPVNIRQVPLSSTSGILCSGLTVQFKKVINLQVGEICSMYIILHPRSSTYPKRINHIKYMIYLEVEHGARIPIEIKAAVTVPFLTFDPTSLDYGVVKCGECCMKELSLENDGLTPVTWRARFCKLEKPRKTLWQKIKKQSMEPQNASKEEINLKQFDIANGTSGVIQPNQKHKMLIRFEPKDEGCQDIKLLFSIENNKQEKFYAILRGIGILPTLQLSHNEIDWGPVLPWSNVSKKFAIKNPNDFCVEYYLPEFDSTIMQEEQVIKILKKAFEMDEIHLPPRDCGEPMSIILHEFYNNVIDDLSAKIVNAVRPGIPNDSRRANFLSSPNLKHLGKSNSKSSMLMSPRPNSPFDLGNPEEIEAMIHDFVQEGLDNGKLSNPIEKVWNEYMTQQNSLDRERISLADSLTYGSLIEDIMIIFHGAPMTDHVYTAHKIGKALGLDVINVDMLIIECLLKPTPNSPHKRKIKQILNFIDVNYNNQMDRFKIKPKSTVFTDENLVDESESSMDDECIPDPIGALYDKVTFILNPQGDLGRTLTKKQRSRDMKKKSVISESSKSSSPAKSKPVRLSTIKPKAIKTDKRIPSRCRQMALLRKKSKPHVQGKKSPRKEEPVVEDEIPDPVIHYIPTEFIMDLLKERLASFKTGIIIDTLNSVFIHSSSELLQCLLTVKKNIKYTLVIMYGLWKSDLESYFRQKRLLELEKQNEYNQRRVKQIASMTTEEYKRLSSSQHALYETVVLKQRRNKFDERQDVLSQKIFNQLRNLKQDRNKKAMKFFIPKKKKHQKQSDKQKERLSHLEKANKYSDPSSHPHSQRPSSSNTLKDEEEYLNSHRHIFPKVEEWENECSKIIDICAKFEKVSPKDLEDLTKVQKLRTQSRYHLGTIKKQPSMRLYDSQKRSSGSVVHVSENRQDLKRQASRRNSIGSRRRSSSISKPTLIELSRSEIIEVGIPLWILDCSKPENPTLNYILKFLQEDVELNKIIQFLKKAAQIIDTKPIHKRCAVYNLPNKRYIQKQESECFTIMNADVDNDHSENPRGGTARSDIISVRSLDGGKRQSKSRKKKSDSVSIASKPLSVHEESRIKSRGILYSKQIVEYKIIFNPTKLGVFEHKYLFETQGWPKAEIVTCKGYCEIPHIDTDVTLIFPIVKIKKEHAIETEPVFYLSSQTLDFGGCLLGRTHEKMAPAKFVELNLTNASKMECNIHFLMFGGSPAFDFYPKSMNIPVGKIEKLKIFASPLTLGVIQDQFGIFVKNNPHIEMFKLQVQGIKFDCDFTDKRVNFDRLLIFRKLQKKLVIKNKSILEVLWRFVNFEEFKKLGFDLSAIQGTVPPLSEIQIGMEYTGYKAQQIKYLLDYEMYESQGRGEPYVRDKIEVLAESFDVQIDVYFAMPEFTHIQFGDLKVSIIYKQKVGFYNRSVYPVNYKIDIIPNNKHTQQVLMWGIEPPEGIMMKESLTPITFAVLPKQAISLNKLDVFMVYLTDKVTKTRIAQFPLQVSFTSYYSEYEICPNILDFGPLLLEDEKVLYITLKNIGKFPFSYKIQGGIIDTENKIAAHYSALRQIEKTGKKGKSKEKTEKKSKNENKKLTRKDKTATSGEHDFGPPLIFSIFEIGNISSSVAVDEIKQIPISCLASELGKHEATIQIFISECLPQFNKSGHVITLKALIDIPKVNLYDFDSVFRESYIFDTRSEFQNLPKKIGSYTVFTKNELPALRFQQICLNKEFTTRIRIKNIGQIPAIIFSKLYSKDVIKTSILRESAITESETTLYESVGPFSLFPKHLYLNPYVEGVINITFHPILIQNYECDLVFNLVLPQYVEPCMLNIKLIGDVEIPTVIIEDPKFVDDNYSINYPLCLIGQQCKKKLSFKNIGNIPAKISLHLLDDKQIFYFLIDEELKQRCTCILNEGCDNDNVITQDFIMSINCDETVDTNVTFDCKTVGAVSTTLDINIFDNPFENRKITMNAEGFYDDMMIIGLPLSKLRLSPPTSSGRRKAATKVASVIGWTDGTGPTVYALEFGAGHVNDLRAVYFTLSNCTDKLQYFEFVPLDINDASIITFSPTSGFMAGYEKKDIVATYISSEPIAEHTGKVELRVSDAINNLTGESPEEEPLPPVPEKKVEKKERLRSSAKSTTKARSIIEHEVPKKIGLNKLPGTERKYTINTFANTSYSEFTCLIENVEFENTMIFERREIEFQVTNTADVSLTIDWYVKDMNSRVRNSTFDTNIPNLLEAYRPPSSRYKTKPKPVKIKPEKWSQMDEDVNLLRQLSSSFRNNSDDYIAFNIIPDYIEIPPNCQQTFTIYFMPLDAVSHKCLLISEIKHLSPTQKNIIIELTGNGLFPYCHFQTEFSDYIISQRRDKSLPYLSDDWKVIEFNLVGLFNTTTRAFKILNPMDDEIFFSWNRILDDDTDDSKSKENVNKFLCRKPIGSIKKHRYDVAEFSFHPSEYGIFEDKYLFYIENYKWSANFLFVANVRKARIYCQNAILHLKPTICGIDIQDELILKNDENFCFSFHFDERTMDLVESGRKLLLEPKEGILPSNSETSIKVTYKSEKNGDFIFDLRCIVQGLDEPLKMVVCGSCYKLDPVVSCTRMGVPKETLEIGKPYIISQNNVCEEFNEFMDFSIKNKGKTKFFYVWSFDTTELDEKFMIKIEPDKGHVRPNCTEMCTILIKTLQKSHLENIRLLLEIAYGPTYEIFLNLDSLAPAYRISFKKHNFGACFIRPEPIWFYQTILQIKNIDNIPLTVEYLTSNTPFLKVDYQMTTILPKETVNIKVFFQPREKKYYKYIVTFTVNSLPCDVQFEGEGIDLMVQLANPNDAVVNFGQVLINTTAERTITVRNASMEPVEVLVDLQKRLPLVQTKRNTYIKPVKTTPESKIKKSAKNDKSGKNSIPHEDEPNDPSSLVVVNQNEKYIFESIRILPSKSVSIASKKESIFKILFSPKTYIPPFDQLLSIQMVHDNMPLSLVKGEAVGLNITLSQNSIPFGVVTKGCQLTSCFLLQNKGGVDIKFNWEFKKHSSHFTMEPMNGLVGAGQSVKHSVTFCPQELSSCMFRAEAICKIDGLKNMLVVFTGRCEDLPSPTSNLVMRCPVRDTQISIISIHNYSTGEWELIPTIWGEYFSCDESIVIGPGMSGSVSITYKPQTMTGVGETHKGYIFLKYPNGKGELHNLLGIAEHPNPEEEQTYNLSAKKDHTLQLIVNNWLPCQQKFNVITEQVEMKSDKKNDKIIPNYKVTGQDSIEVPGSWGKQYMWTFYGYNEGSVKFKVVFINMDSNEFLYYLLVINVTKCESLETITLSTPIRLPKKYDLIISNPLNQSIELEGSCQSPYIKFESPFTIPPKDKATLPITYCPLVMEQVETKLELNTFRNLGSYEYTLELNGLAPLNEKLRTVTTYFGKTESIFLEIFTCSSGKKYDFIITSTHPNIFVVQRTVTIINSGTLTVMYDPCELGTTDGIITAESPIAGKYTYPIQGICLYPKPIGPYTLTLKTRMEINFRNPFITDQVFSIRGEPQGVINVIQKSGQDTIKAKAEKKIIITMGNISNNDTKSLVTGRVIIQSKHPIYANISWTYYFQNDIQDM